MKFKDQYWLTPENIAASLKAAKPWSRDADVPDPLDFTDFKRRPDLLAQAIEKRLVDSSLWGTTRRMPAPKPQGETRRLTCVDPIAEIGFRQIGGRLAHHVERSLPAAVFSTRIETVGDTWQAQPWQQARRRFDNAVRSGQSEGTYEGKGALDVASHYPTVQHDHLQEILNSVGAPAGAVQDLIGVLASLPTSAAGIPIGPEASAILGTVALLPLDRLLARGSAKVFRWMDDFVVLISGEAEYLELKGRAEQQLKLGGQNLNAGKCTYEPLGTVSFEDLLLSGDTGDGSFARDPANELRVYADYQEPGRVRALLGQLRRNGDARGIEIIRTHPWILDRFPKQTTSYLHRVANAIGDWAWIVESLLRETDDSDALTQLHLARILPSDQLGPSVARQLFDKALTTPPRDYAPLANELFVAVGRSSESVHIRRNRAMDYAMEQANLDVLRALLSTFRDGNPSVAHKHGIASVTRRVPELAALGDAILAA